MSRDDAPDRTAAPDPSITRGGTETAGAPADDSWAGFDPLAPSADTAMLSDRYEDRGLIGRGGQGEVRRVWDRKLERMLAVKILTRPQPAAARRFRTETRLTIELSHPSIIPVYDQGATADGRPWFAMKPVQGVELSVGIAACHGRPSDPEWTLRRLLNIFVRVCDAVAYAHEQGVVHRDLKPGNVMVGRFGEVWVMDWGIARRVDDVPVEVEPELSAHDPMATQLGMVLGTPGYMPPEQAGGLAHLADRRSDVYALGGILFAILTGQRPTGRPGPRFVDRPLHEPLVELCRAAMAHAPDERPADADAMRRAVSDWLDGARRRAEAREFVRRAESLRPMIDALEAEAVALELRAAALLDPIPPHAPEALKHPGWRLEAQARERRRRATLTEMDFERTLRAARQRAPDLTEADALLADFYRDHLARAESARDADAIARNAALLAEHDRGRHAAYLTGLGRWTLLTDPPDARMTLHRYVERDRRLVAEPVEVLRGPVMGRSIEQGSYLLIIEADGRVAVRYPMHLGRGDHWDGVAPGADAPTPIRLPEVGELGPGDIYVPAGWAWVGGDPEAGDGLPRRRVWVDGFVMRRFPVTVGELLDEPATAGRVPESARSRPRDHAVTSVSWHDAMACADAFAARSGVPWRLPDGVEWEKAARGVDGRFWPWGDTFDASRARVIESFAGTPDARPVGDAAADESPYGVRDIVGGVREWCLGVYRRGGPDGPRACPRRPDADDDGLREGRGGSWSARAATARPAGRFAGRAAFASDMLGFRLARPFG